MKFPLLKRKSTYYKLCDISSQTENSVKQATGERVDSRVSLSYADVSYASRKSD
jgi:hypothetical protein